MKKTVQRIIFIIFLGLLLSSYTYGANYPKLALLTVSNSSGVDSIGGRKLTATISELFGNTLKKQKFVEYYDLEQTKKLLRNAGLDAYYLISNMCSNEDLIKIGKKINMPALAFLDIDGYNEIKRERAKTSYQLALSLKVVNCADMTSQEYTSEGINDGDRNQAFSNAVMELINHYTNQETEDVNRGNLRANSGSVIGNTLSRRYHLAGVNHLPQPEKQVFFPSRSEAEKNSYQPCPICFPGYKSFSYGDRDIEERLGSEACGVIEYYYRSANEPELVAKLNRIAAPLIRDTIRNNIDYKFRILDSNEVNAFSAPNGYIYVTKGLCDIIESDDELAFVIAHEMGHLEKKHAVQRYKAALTATFFASIFIAATSKNNDATTTSLFAIIMTSIFLKGFSQDQEKEADEVALEHLKNSGYDYKIYHTLMGRFIDMRQRRIYAIEKIFATHPTPEKRISSLDESLKAYETLQAKINL